jgi:hypothetical protein
LLFDHALAAVVASFVANELSQCPVHVPTASECVAFIRLATVEPIATFMQGTGSVIDVTVIPIKSPSAEAGSWLPAFTLPLANGGVKKPQTPSFGVGDRFKYLDSR